MRRPDVLVAVLGLASLFLVAPEASAAPAAPPRTPAGTATVTLITGGTVLVTGDDITVHPAPGREDVRFRVERSGATSRVLPADALPLLRTGRLDERLLDITLPLREGYSGGDLPLLIDYPGQAKTAQTATTIPGVRLTRTLPVTRTLAVRADRTGRARLWSSLTGSTLRSAVGKVWLDGRSHVALDVSVAQVGAPAAWQAGFDGTGATVGVLDTGVDLTHPDLAGRIVATKDFTGEGIDYLFGHGTHVASITAGSGAASGGRYRGVAPGANLVIGKVCDRHGGCFDSDILAGMEWAAPLAQTVN
ncbi:S8 family serine peptidase [Actinoplanes derwentensis]|uniref:Subtilase family protein n=1 Tax=Actinoplanes derwentensis TaxID=113562 RepID=A0A1H1R0C0_9ACTN|nr:S8 family serine peptidase [Actinoplanes derwentensis]GID87116.1 hypothetical protein Ade03nite_60400 [Actinoplanes derwentensis]SDS29060.1 Subtilase family protein [Actinoplanes derwentensis]